MKRMGYKTLASEDIGIRCLSISSITLDGEPGEQDRCEECYDLMYSGASMVKFDFKSFDVSEPETEEDESWLLCRHCGRKAAAVLLGKL